MAKFLTGSALNAALDRILESATQLIMLISPYIKLHERTKESLLNHLNNPNVGIVIVFGKNEDDITKSLSPDDLRFFIQFLNIEIRYESRLHAKYYSNESEAIITSMNLYGYSQNNNIEAGILLKQSILGNVIGDNNIDYDAYQYFQKVIDNAVPIYIKVPIFDRGLAGTGLNKKYISSEVRTNRLNEFFVGFNTNQESAIRPKLPKLPIEKPQGYCIRSGVAIRFNPKQPLSQDAYKSWAKFSNPDYPEKYCHFSGEASNGETCVAKPILYKNWKQAKEVHGL